MTCEWPAPTIRSWRIARDQITELDGGDRQRIAKKWDFSNRRKIEAGNPSIAAEVEQPVLQLVQENPSWATRGGTHPVLSNR